MLRKWKACGIIVFLTAVAFLSVSPIAVKTSTAQDATGTLADILERGKIKVGSEIAYPPMEDYDPVTGEEIGFDIDLMDAIMEHVSDAYDTDLTVEWIYSDWTPIIPNLLAEQFDVIMSSMTITSERELQVDFTRWYYQSAMGILVAEDNPKNILTENDLNDSSIKIGVQIGTTTHLWLQAYDIDDVATVMTYTSFPEAIEQLKLDAVDCVLGDVIVLNYEAQISGGTKMVHSFFGDEIENFGIACRPDDTDLINALNDALDWLLGDDINNPEANEKYNEIYEKWHGTGYMYYSEEEEDTPAFDFVVALVVLIGSSILVIRRRRKA